MTCIIAIKSDEGIVLAGDSIGSNSHSYNDRDDTKVFKLKHLTIGFTSSYRFGQILRYHVTPPPFKSGTVERYLVKKFVPVVRAAMKEHGYGAHTDSDDHKTGRAIIVCGDTIAVLQEDFHIALPSSNIVSVGIGCDAARGSAMAQLRFGVSPKKAARRAVLDAASFVEGVGGRVTVLKGVQPE